MPRNVKADYSFTVDWGGAGTNIIEISGLNIILDVNEYRDGNDPNQLARKTPGHTHYTNIILKRRLLKGNNDFFSWMNATNLNQVDRRDIIIKLLNKKRQPIITWKAIHAFPVRYSSPVLNVSVNDAATEELELTHEGLIIETI